MISPFLSTALVLAAVAFHPVDFSMEMGSVENILVVALILASSLKVRCLLSTASQRL